ncbi:MAG: WD40/YVTN/BNR-like repeat-containing protein [Thermomicrobiales bacterium]
MRRPPFRSLVVVVVAFALSACATDTSPTAPQPSPPTPTPTVAAATPRVPPTPRFVTATPTSVVVPSLPGPPAAHVVAYDFNRLPDTQTISDYGDPKVLAYIIANWPHTQATAPICSRSETTRVPGVSSFITDDAGWMICALYAMKGIQVKQLYKTEDGGVSWTLISETQIGGRGGRIPTTLPDGGMVDDLFFADAAHGWLSVDQESGPSDYQAFSHSYLLATDDGGRSWRPVFVTDGQDRITHIAFKSSTDGYLAVLDPLTRLEVVLSTQDGGATWMQIYPAPVADDLWHFVDAQHGVGSGTLLDPAAILITEDGGMTWRQVGSLRNGKIGTVIALSFPDPLHGWAAVQYDRTSAVLRTTDGGVTWTPIFPDGAKSANFAYSGFLLDGQTGYAFTVDGQAWITHDGGNTFQPTNEFAPRSSPVPTIRAQTGRSPLAFQLYTYYPPGSSGWVRIPLVDEIDGFHIEDGIHTRDTVRSCDSRQARNCQILLFVSVNGGDWTRYDLGAVLPLRVQFDGNVMRWMGRPAGPLYRTDDGGQSWTQIR